MTTASLLERAKGGDGDAIATLLNRALAPQGITVSAQRHAYCLEVHLEGQPLPDQTSVVATIRQGIERLQITSIGVVQIHGSLKGYPDIGWSEEISLLGALADPGTPFPAANPAAAVANTTSPGGPADQAIPSAHSALSRAYRTLGLTPDVPLTEVDSTYFRRRAELLGQGKREAVADLKAAHTLIKEHSQRRGKQPPISGFEAAKTRAGVEALPQLLRSRGLEGKARLKNSRLQIRLEPHSSQNPNRASAILYTLLEQEDLAALGLDQIAKIEVYGLASSQKVGWKRLVPMPPPPSAADTDVLSFQNRYVSALVFPLLLLLGGGMNALPMVNYLLFGVKIWFHEFGHAIIAWLAGRRAIPLPIGWTNVGEERSLFVYFGLLILLGLLFWVGRREGLRWPMVLAVGLVVIQFWFTWLMPEPRYETLLSFGGIGGELYLCTLLMVSFFFPLPAYWRWDFYRYPVVLGAAFTFWGQIWLWRQINRGVAAIPWGSLWGGEAHGDMNNLRYAGWSDQHIINTYTTLGNLCLLVLVSVYLYVAMRQNHHHLFALTQRWLARQ